MKGKVAFVLGAAVGYVLGTRAGRERYVQIKRGAQQIWETTPVQRGVGYVRDAAQCQIDSVKAAAVRAGKNAFSAFVQQDSARQAAPATQRPTHPAPAAPAETTSAGEA